MRTYAIRLNVAETIDKIKELQHLIEETGAVGIHPDHPYAYVMFRTPDDQVNGFKLFSQTFRRCHLVANVAEIPD
jgi:hypothetical protein